MLRFVPRVAQQTTDVEAEAGSATLGSDLASQHQVPDTGAWLTAALALLEELSVSGPNRRFISAIVLGYLEEL